MKKNTNRVLWEMRSTRPSDKSIQHESMRKAYNRVTMHFKHTSIYCHTGMQAYSMPRYTGMQAYRQTDRETDNPTDRQADRHPDTETHRHTDSQTH